MGHSTGGHVPVGSGEGDGVRGGSVGQEAIEVMPRTTN